ncbi:hypothetical protein GCM10027168_35780 [Streptomyces capparidis]
MADLVVLAEPLDKNKVTPGVLGFLVFAAIGVAVWLLMKNMNKQFSKIDFEEQPESGGAAPAAGAARGTGGEGAPGRRGRQAGDGGPGSA